MTRDARRARATHPRVARLPTRFAVAEEEGGRWQAHGPFLHSPAAVREHLAAYFDLVVPLMPGSSPRDLASREAADLLRDGTRRAEVDVLGRRHRVVRVEYIVRCGRTAPSRPARPSRTWRSPSPATTAGLAPRSPNAAAAPVAW